MGLLDRLLPRKNNVPLLTAGKHQIEDGDDITSMNAMSTRISESMRKSMDATNFMAFDELGDDKGGFFGPEFDIRSTAGRIKTLYGREPWIATVATLLARTCSNIPLKTYNKGTTTEVPNHPISLLMKSSGPFQDEMARNWTAYLDFALAGNGFLVTDEFYRTLMHVPVELAQLKFDDNTKRVSGLEIFGANQGQFQLPSFVDIKYVIHLKMPNPYTPFYGFSLFSAAARPILLDRYKNEFEMAFYLRGATNSGVVESTEDISKSRMQRLMRTFENAFTGKANWWRTLFLPKGAKWTNSSLSMADMQHLEGLKENRLTILAVLGIPPSIVGIVQDVNRATSEQQERIFYQNTIIPFMNFIASAWTGSYVNKVIYRDEVEVRPDFSGIESVQGSIETKGEQSKAMENYFLIDEIRDIVWKKAALPDEKGQVFAAQLKTPAVAVATEGGANPVTPSALALLARNDETTATQSVKFSKFVFHSAKDVESWLKAAGFTATVSPSETEDHYESMQKSADLFVQGSFLTVDADIGVTAKVGKMIKALPESREQVFTRLKAMATNSQNRLERRIGDEFTRVMKKYRDYILDEAIKAITHKSDVDHFLGAHREERQKFYLQNALPVLGKAMSRGFSMASAQVRTITGRWSTKAKVSVNLENDVDQQAIAVLRERTEDGKLKQLERRVIENFKSFDETTTENIMKTIADMMEQGETFETIAADLRSKFEEDYAGQMDTIVRTEVLSAVSDGLAWNHEVLGQVFSKVQKQWMTQGDAGVNPDARDEHADFENQGPIDSDSTWKAEDGSDLDYPRDPNASAGQVINCRCTMISVIPEDATSNSDSILETEM